MSQNIFIIWNINDDAAFRARYLEMTGEAVQENSLQNTDGTKYMIGSSRITVAQIDILRSTFAIETGAENFIAAEDTE